MPNWGHAGFYIDCHRMTVPENILLQKSTGCDYFMCVLKKCLLSGGINHNNGLREIETACRLLGEDTPSSITAPIGNERVPNIIINNITNLLFFLNCSQHFGNFK